MTTCFLFVDHLDEENCLSLCLNHQAQVEAPLMFRTIDEIKILQNNAKTIIVLSSLHSSMYEVELPFTNENKVRAAIPYILEEKLAQSIPTLHFAFDKQYYKNHKYLVTAIDLEWLTSLLMRLKQLNIVFDVVTLDWFALNLNEACIYESRLLVNEPEFIGALSLDLLSLYKSQNILETFVFKDSNQVSQFAAAHIIEQPGSLWIAQHILKKPLFNICQGELARLCRKSNPLIKWYYALAGISGIYLLTMILSYSLMWLDLNWQLKDIDHSIAKIYYEFFPKNTKITNPRLQISQKIQQQVNHNQILWKILCSLTRIVHAPDRIVSLRFQSNNIIVIVSCQDFSALEHLSDKLKNVPLHVTQTEASVQDEHVMATLELSL